MQTCNSLFKATTLYIIGSFFNKAIALLLLPFFTALLSTSSYGIVSTYTSWVNIVGILVSVQFGYTIRNAIVDFKSEINEYINCINMFCFIIYIILLSILLTTKTIISNNDIIILIAFCLTQSFFNAVINVELQKQMMQFEYIKRTCLLSLPSLLSAVIGVGILYYNRSVDYWGRIIPMVVVYSVIGGYYFLSYNISTKKTSIHKIKEYLRYALTLSLPLILHGLASVVLSNIDKTMINYYISSSETGIYSVAYTMGMVLLAVTSAMESVWIPWFTKKMKEEQYDSINIAGGFYIKIGSLICVIALLCMPEILKMFASKPYWQGIRIIFPIIFASYTIFLFTICANIECYYKSTKHIAVNTFVACICNVLLNAILIPKYAALGAAYATMISYLISFSMHYRYSKNLNKNIFPIKIYLEPMTITLTFFIVADYLRYASLIRWGIAGVILIIFLLYIYKYKNLVKAIRE